MSQYDPKFDLNKYRSQLPIFHSPVILPYTLKSISCINTIFADYPSVSLRVWPQNKCRSQWCIFHSPVILPYIEEYLVFWIMSHYDPKFDLKKKCSSQWPIFHGPVMLYFEEYFMYKHHIFWIWVSMTRHLKYVTYFPMYCSDITLPNAGVTLTSTEFMFHFIGKAWFRQTILSCDILYDLHIFVWVQHFRDSSLNCVISKTMLYWTML